MRDRLNDYRWAAAAALWTCAALLGTRWPTMAARCDRWATNLEDDEGVDLDDMELATFLAANTDLVFAPWQMDLVRTLREPIDPTDLTPFLEQARLDVTDLAKATSAPAVVITFDPNDFQDPAT